MATIEPERNGLRADPAWRLGAGARQPVHGRLLRDDPRPAADLSRRRARRVGAIGRLHRRHRRGNGDDHQDLLRRCFRTGSVGASCWRRLAMAFPPSPSRSFPLAQQPRLGRCRQVRRPARQGHSRRTAGRARCRSQPGGRAGRELRAAPVARYGRRLSWTACGHRAHGVDGRQFHAGVLGRGSSGIRVVWAHHIRGPGAGPSRKR